MDRERIKIRDSVQSSPSSAFPTSHVVPLHHQGKSREHRIWVERARQLLNMLSCSSSDSGILGVLRGTCRESRAVAGVGWLLSEGTKRHDSVNKVGPWLGICP